MRALIRAADLANLGEDVLAKTLQRYRLELAKQLPVTLGNVRARDHSI